VTRNNLAKKTTRDESRRRTIVRRTLGLGQIDENRSEARMSRSSVGGEAGLQEPVSPAVVARWLRRRGARVVAARLRAKMARAGACGRLARARARLGEEDGAGGGGSPVAGGAAVHRRQGVQRRRSEGARAAAARRARADEKVRPKTNRFMKG
jgi:hypothetical protein